jgi:hypothetical protein
LDSCRTPTKEEGWIVGKFTCEGIFKAQVGRETNTLWQSVLFVVPGPKLLSAKSGFASVVFARFVKVSLGQCSKEGILMGGVKL